MDVEENMADDLGRIKLEVGSCENKNVTLGVTKDEILG
jgi:hypothetical protein